MISCFLSCVQVLTIVLYCFQNEEWEVDGWFTAAGPSSSRLNFPANCSSLYGFRT
ncbi:hypothetical protein PR003_g9793 [Phytophthora rubi]|uniref:Uncharacterized protein n=1 Tax=Phytophthora rubi TaxID=129364 RepID=A0A6A3MW76_9STRA|nr:hypothetical protein PR002_g9524 [Phytophthora rubi]KAE9035419.1 hypothetical protein PR001_g9309 [Phytophthora rubi]KAE9341783.1 hypothetical protein PR003_g9793 [Phytophthora rubi]